MPSILVVDDDMAILRLLVELFQDEGWDVLQAVSGEQALAALTRGVVPAVVLLDLMLPGISGEQVLGELRHLHPDLPVVLMSARRDVKAVARRAGATACVSKPFDLEVLLATISGSAERPPDL